jgi:peptidoglycan/xylan/chitin deacetylase (PgdA/CDA1 family)
MKRRLKSAIFFVLYYTGIEWFLARLIPANAVAVLMYHGVCDDAAIPPEINFHLPWRIFERQMRALKRRYRVVPLVEVVKRLEQGEPLDKAVAITFDDGYRNNATQAAPILSQLRLPYTVFLSTKYVSTSEWLPLNRIYWAWSGGKINSEEMKELRKQIRTRPAADVPEILKGLPPSDAADSTAAQESFAMLNWTEVTEMARACAHFGSHTHSHCNMAVEPKESQEEELKISHRLIERNLPGQPDLFAYPYGKAAQMSDTARASIVANGYKAAISAEYGVVTSHSDRYALPRLGYDESIWNFTGEILYQFAKQSVRDAWFADAPRPARPDVTTQAG